VSTWSKNTGLGIGVVIVNRQRRIISTWYNGFPKDLPDSAKLYTDNAIKHYRMIHAEINAILQAKQDLTDHIMFIYGTAPCAQCAAVIIQSGISAIYIQKEEAIPPSWIKSCQEAEWMLDEAFVDVILI